MSFRETLVDASGLKARVLAERELHEPLGAFASADRVSYMFLAPYGVHALSAALETGEVASCAADVPAFDWDEREMRDERGVVLAGHPDDRPLYIEGGRVPEALVAQGRGVTAIVVGPVHAGIIEPGRFTFSSGGETVVHLDAQLGYSRRGIERALEGRDALDAASAIARICGGCSASRSWAYALAIEELAGVSVREGPGVARAIVAELERLYNHVFDLASMSAGAGYGRGQMQGLRLKERVQRACARFAGHRYCFDAIVPGGVRAGILTDRDALRAEIAALRNEVERYGHGLLHADTAASRFLGAGIVAPELARAFGAVGPARRASGGGADVRAFAPYGAYRRLPVAVAQAEEGDVHARARVKFEEALASLRLLSEAAAMLGDTPLEAPEAIGAAPGRMAAVTEGPRGAETVFVEIGANRVLRRVHVSAASYRNWPVVARAMEGNIVPDFPLVNKSFNLCYACADR